MNYGRFLSIFLTSLSICFSLKAHADSWCDGTDLDNLHRPITQTYPGWEEDLGLVVAEQNVEFVNNSRPNAQIRQDRCQGVASNRRGETSADLDCRYYEFYNNMNVRHLPMNIRRYLGTMRTLRCAFTQTRSGRGVSDDVKNRIYRAVVASTNPF